MYHKLCNVNHFLGKIQKYFAFLPPEAQKYGFCVIFPAEIAVFGLGLAALSSAKAQSDCSLGDRANCKGNGKKDFFEKKRLTKDGKALYLYYMK